ncbi:MAG TPA: hypothetical protein VJ242_01895 [Patescibacteria group bacterium]|nr:hypothetical protein [Patescibacteria group bacterium]
MGPKTLVTHIFPDLDAITSLWLFDRYDDDFESANLQFVPAGSTFEGKAVDSDPDIVHVDTGLGRFDHHHTDERTCAAKLIFEHLLTSKKIKSKDVPALKRLTELVVQIDQFEDFFWPEPANDRYDLGINQILDHLKLSGRLNDKELVYQGFSLLDALLAGLKFKVKAEEEIKAGIEFTSPWGKSLGVETRISAINKLAQKLGFALVVRKEPGTGFVSLKSQPKPELDLTSAYEALKKADPKADWYFHPSKHIILNGSRHNLKVKPSNLSLKEVIKEVSNLTWQ